MVRIKHSYNAGDLIVLLSSLKFLFDTKGIKTHILQRLNFPAYYFDGAEHPIKNREGQQVCMNEEMFDRLYPLIVSQSYVEDFSIWTGQQFTFDVDITRDSKAVPMPNGNIHQWNGAVIPDLHSEPHKQWLHVEHQSIRQDKFKNKIIINRTQRYTNPYISFFFLKPFEDRILFTGTTDEYQLFCKQNNLEVEHLKTDNFYQLAQIISWCKFGIYNQSLTFHIADGLKAKRILELSPHFPNTFVTGDNGRQFYHQKSLEHYFNQYLNEV